MKKIKNFLKSESGFSLIEIAIALVVVGLLIGGVLKGRKLIENAKINKVASNIDMYRMAIHLFNETYGSLPGDFHLASKHIYHKLRDGKNDGIIGGHGLNPPDESANMWGHLAQAGLIGDMGQLPESGFARRGEGIPEGKIGGVITIQHNPHEEMSGHWLLLGRENGSRGDGALLTPHQARALSQKMDSPDPHAGLVRGHHGMDVTPEDCIKDGQFNGENSHPACILYFQL
jgi:prepilin-type N-terminal cleavage/methylation domain-containing protein